MERVSLPGLRSDIARGQTLFVDNEVIIAGIGRGSIQRYNKKKGAIDQNQSSFYVKSQCKQESGHCYRESYHRTTAFNGSVWVTGCDLNAKVTQLTENDHFKYQHYNSYTTIPWELPYLTRHGIYTNLDSDTEYSFPSGHYIASFVHNDRIYMIQKAAKKAYSIPVDNNADVEEHTIKSKLLFKNIFKLNSLVVQDTVFLYEGTGPSKCLYRLNLATFELDELTGQLRDLSKCLAFTLHGTSLYATSKELNGGELFWTDLSCFVESDEEYGIDSFSVQTVPECLNCNEPMKNPKIFSLCGHSICGDCEPKITKQRSSDYNELTCPECKQQSSFQWYIKLPDNIALKEERVRIANRETAMKVPKKPKKREEPKEEKKSLLQCQYCNDLLVESKTFNCDFCANRDVKPEVFVCGACVVNFHMDHFASVKPAVFADKQSLEKELGHISRDPEAPKREKSALSSEIALKVNQELGVFFQDMQEKYKKVNERVEKLKSASAISQRALEQETDGVLDDENDINTKIQKLADWKKGLYDYIAKLNTNKKCCETHISAANTSIF